MPGEPPFLSPVLFRKDDAILVLKLGTDSLPWDADRLEDASRPARCETRDTAESPSIRLRSKAGGEEAARVRSLARPGSGRLSVEAAGAASGIMERGVEGLVLLPGALPDIRRIVALVRQSREFPRRRGQVGNRARQAGLPGPVGVLEDGQGCGRQFQRLSFPGARRTRDNEHVAIRSFRVNAGACIPLIPLHDGRTRHQRAGDPALAVGEADGGARPAVVPVSLGKAGRTAFGRPIEESMEGQRWTRTRPRAMRNGKTSELLPNRGRISFRCRRNRPAGRQHPGAFDQADRGFPADAQSETGGGSGRIPALARSGNRRAAVRSERKIRRAVALRHIERIGKEIFASSRAAQNADEE